MEWKIEMNKKMKNRKGKWKMKTKVGKLAGNAVLLSIHSMALDVGNYAKVNENNLYW